MSQETLLTLRAGYHSNGTSTSVSGLWANGDSPRAESRGCAGRAKLWAAPCRGAVVAIVTSRITKAVWSKTRRLHALFGWSDGGWLQSDDVARLQTLVGFLEGELNLLSFNQLSEALGLNCRVVDKDIFLAFT